MKKFIFIFSILWISSFMGNAQSFLYELEDSLSADDLVRVIKGSGIDTFFNAQVGHCGPRQRGRFDAHGQPNDLGMDAGIILSNYCVKTDSSIMMTPEQPYLRGLGFPQYASGGHYPTGAGGGLQDDPDETGIPEIDTTIIGIYESLPPPNHADWAGSDGNCFTQFRCGLSFDFIPTGDTISFRYVFASDNYPELKTCAPDFDAFFALLSGPGLEGKENIAVVPGTDVLVGSNTISNYPMYGGGPVEYCTSIHEDAPFSEYYIDNWVLLSDHVPYNGFTTVLETKYAVTPCDTYRIELTVNGLSGNVHGLIEAGSFKSNGEVQKCGDTASSVSGSLGELPFCMAYPSPFTSTLQIKLQGNTSVSSLYHVGITDITGRDFFREEGSLLSINLKLTDIGSRLSPGVYFLRVEDKSSGRVQMLKVVKE
ncbi:MAG: T9SS type A sorting domain-containing protein [Taibaiella sp.]|nr:T9SS type A sorting domain-containing protein [Taibaiella sp.]